MGSLDLTNWKVVILFVLHCGKRNMESCHSQSGFCWAILERLTIHQPSLITLVATIYQGFLRNHKVQVLKLSTYPKTSRVILES